MGSETRRSQCMQVPTWPPPKCHSLIWKYVRHAGRSFQNTSARYTPGCPKVITARQPSDRRRTLRAAPRASGACCSNAQRRNRVPPGRTVVHCIDDEHNAPDLSRGTQAAPRWPSAAWHSVQVGFRAGSAPRGHRASDSTVRSDSSITSLASRKAGRRTKSVRSVCRSAAARMSVDFCSGRSRRFLACCRQWPLWAWATSSHVLKRTQCQRAGQPVCLEGVQHFLPLLTTSAAFVPPPALQPAPTPSGNRRCSRRSRNSDYRHRRRDAGPR